MRIEWELDDFDLERKEIPEAFSPLAHRISNEVDVMFY
ncbi:MAG: hypothetical protein KCCBMMGE_00979 [Candidatus Methanoperedenaceae archaeon GB37]|nr:MAG: hypothetical protein KCCBMMGE_00979 [Candidatus Methanoperedenaceae archaeon GB37]